jgi:hypothetical protein
MCLLVGCAEGPPPVSSPEVTAEAIRLLDGQEYRGNYGNFNQVWLFKKSDLNLLVKYNRDPYIPAVVSKIGPTIHLEMVNKNGVWTQNGVKRQVEVHEHVDVSVDGSTITGSGGPIENDRQERISLTRKTH